MIVETSAIKWIQKLHQDISQNIDRIPRGGWDIITNKFNQKFKENKSVVDMRNKYNMIKDKNQITEVRNEPEQHPGRSRAEIKNVNLYINVRNVLLQNIAKYCDTNETKEKTPKV